MDRELRVVLSARVFSDQKCFGPGVSQLLKRVDELHSLRAAALSMSMAYSKAWTVVRNAAASASDRSRYFGSDKTITHENGNLYGKTDLNPKTEKSANAQLRSNGRSLTGTNINGISNDVRYRQMLSNGRVHDTDGFLFDGENTHYNTLK